MQISMKKVKLRLSAEDVNMMKRYFRTTAELLYNAVMNENEPTKEEGEKAQRNYKCMAAYGALMYRALNTNTFVPGVLSPGAIERGWKEAVELFSEDDGDEPLVEEPKTEEPKTSSAAHVYNNWKKKHVTGIYKKGNVWMANVEDTPDAVKILTCNKCGRSECEIVPCHRCGLPLCPLHLFTGYTTGFLTSGSLCGECFDKGVPPPAQSSDSTGQLKPEHLRPEEEPELHAGARLRAMFSKPTKETEYGMLSIPVAPGVEISDSALTFIARLLSARLRWETQHTPGAEYSGFWWRLRVLQCIGTIENFDVSLQRQVWVEAAALCSLAVEALENKPQTRAEQAMVSATSVHGQAVRKGGGCEMCAKGCAKDEITVQCCECMRFGCFTCTGGQLACKQCIKEKGKSAKREHTCSAVRRTECEVCGGAPRDDMAWQCTECMRFGCATCMNAHLVCKECAEVEGVVPVHNYPMEFWAHVEATGGKLFTDHGDNAAYFFNQATRALQDARQPSARKAALLHCAAVVFAMYLRTRKIEAARAERAKRPTNT